MYETLLGELDTRRKRTARFRRVALHLHSIDSHDWGSGKTDKAKNDRTRFSGPLGLQTFAEELRQHLDLVAVTDHMKIGFASALSTAVSANDNFVVLPGIEVNFRPEAALGLNRIHLLVIFQEGTSPEVVGRIFEGQPSIPQDDKRTGNEDVVGISLKEFVERVHKNRGLCIAAHVENHQGLRAVFRQTAKDALILVGESDEAHQRLVADSFKEYLLTSGLDGVEIHQSGHQEHYRWESKIDNRTVSIPTVLRFDAHCVEQFGRTERVTHLKMTRPGLAGLKDALLFSDTRIRFPNDLPSPPSPKLLGLQLAGDSTSFFPDVTLAFAENLNCVIGARGSGKSTMVEALRYVLGYNRTLSSLEKLESPIRDLQKANLRGTLIRLVYETSTGDVRVLQATFDDKSDYSTKVFTVAGDPVAVPDVEKSGDFPLRLFGWSEIETLGREPARQRELLDRLVPELASPLSKRDDLRGALRTNRGAIEKVVTELSALLKQDSGELRRYSEYKQDFERLNTEQVKGLFGNLDSARAKQRLLSKLRSNAEDLKVEVTAIKQHSLDADLEELLEAGGEGLRSWWVAHEVALLKLPAVQAEIVRNLDTAVAQLIAYQALVDGHLGEQASIVAGLEKELQAAFAADTSMQRIADLRANAESRLRRVTQARSTYLKKWEALEQVLRQRAGIADELESVQDQITGIRTRHNQAVEQRLNEFLPEAMRVSLALDAGGDSTSFEKKLYEIFGAKTAIAKKVKKLIPVLCNPVSFARALLTNDTASLEKRVVQVEGEKMSLTADDLQQIVLQTAAQEPDEGADVLVLGDDGEKLRTLLQLQETVWDDKEAILLNGRPVNERSPGQRSSAMLPLIALAQRSPLVIDQPEDNLDKKLIGDVLARVLAELKEQRQIIVCTHDPNILVGGDAEQVIVLEAESDRKGTVANHGSIDNDDIVTTIIDLLEGGREAFEARGKRYGEHLGDPR